MVRSQLVTPFFTRGEEEFHGFFRGRVGCFEALLLGGVFGFQVTLFGR